MVKTYIPLENMQLQTFTSLHQGKGIDAIGSSIFIMI